MILHSKKWKIVFCTMYIIMNDMNDIIIIIHAMNSEQFCSLSVNRIINPLLGSGLIV